MAKKYDVLAPNFKKRLSGVTSTIVRLVPIQSNTIDIVAVGPRLAADLPQISVLKTAFLPRKGPSGARVWHARRNIEMIFGLFLKYVLRKHLVLMFTSASQRKHTKLTKILINRMDQVVSTSTKTASYLDVDSTVIMHGIDTKTFCKASDKSAVRTKLNLPIDQPVVGCFGRIRKQKGTDTFVDAMIKIVQQRSDCIGVVMGRATAKDQDFETKLKEKVAAVGLTKNILFMPEVPVWEMASWYQALDIYVAPQRWEGFGLTPLEAMACGVPVIATHVGAFDELVEDGVTGTLIPHSDPAIMSKEIENLLADPAKLENQSKAARRRVEEFFDIKKEADALVSIYRQMLT